MDTLFVHEGCWRANGLWLCLDASEFGRPSRRSLGRPRRRRPLDTHKAVKCCITFRGGGGRGGGGDRPFAQFWLGFFSLPCGVCSGLLVWWMSYSFLRSFMYYLNVFDVQLSKTTLPTINMSFLPLRCMTYEHAAAPRPLISDRISGAHFRRASEPARTSLQDEHDRPTEFAAS